MSEFRSISALLDELAPEVGVEEPAWEDVVRRAAAGDDAVSVSQNGSRPAHARQQRRTRRLSRKRLMVAATAVVAVAFVAVAVALAAGGLHRFSAWISGAPGTPAPVADQTGFARRNAAAFARFPAGTRVRLIARERVADKTFNLLGFRTGDALCLRVVRADLPGARGQTACANLAELEQSPAPGVVVDDLWFSFDRPAISATGVYGFTDDTVKRIAVVRERSGTQSVAVSSNAFLALIAHPAGSVAAPGPQDPITAVYAVRADGSRVRLNYISGSGGTTKSAPPKPPFYLAFTRITVAQLPGPTKPTVRFQGGTISWLAHRTPIGVPYALPLRARPHFGRVLFARAIQPDPQRPDRIALMIVELAQHAFGPRTSKAPVVCFSAIAALDRLGVTSCLGVGDHQANAQLFKAGSSPISFTSIWPSQIAHIGGIAADQVAAIKIFLANGRVIPAQLRNDAFTADVPGSAASKIVSYDTSGHVLSVALLNGPPMHYQPCPAARVPLASSIAPPRPWERLDLATASLNGHPILGATQRQVIAALGPPSRILRNTIINGVRIPDYLYGSSGQATATQIQFGKNGNRIIAVSIQFRSPRVDDTRLGHILARDPARVQHAITRTYPGYKLAAGYGTLDAHGCLFRANRGQQGTHIQVTLGLGAGSRNTPWLDLRRGY